LEIKKIDKKVIYKIYVNPEKINNFITEKTENKNIFLEYDKYSKEDFAKDITVFEKRFIFLSLIY